MSLLTTESYTVSLQHCKVLQTTHMFFITILACAALLFRCLLLAFSSDAMVLSARSAMQNSPESQLSGVLPLWVSSSTENFHYQSTSAQRGDFFQCSVSGSADKAHGPTD
jgi:hypothetical protein